MSGHFNVRSRVSEGSRTRVREDFSRNSDVCVQPPFWHPITMSNGPCQRAQRTELLTRMIQDKPTVLCFHIATDQHPNL